MNDPLPNALAAVTQNGPAPYQQRVIEEKAQLDTRIAALSAFMDSDTFRSLQDEMLWLMVRQHCIMRELSAILAERIKLWGLA